MSKLYWHLTDSKIQLQILAIELCPQFWKLFMTFLSLEFSEILPPIFVTKNIQRQYPLNLISCGGFCWWKISIWRTLLSQKMGLLYFRCWCLFPSFYFILFSYHSSHFSWYLWKTDRCMVDSSCYMGFVEKLHDDGFDVHIVFCLVYLCFDKSG